MAIYRTHSIADQAVTQKVGPHFVGKPEDNAATIAYLASDDAAFVQGTAVRADGGQLDRL